MTPFIPRWILLVVGLGVVAASLDRAFPSSASMPARDGPFEPGGGPVHRAPAVRLVGRVADASTREGIPQARVRALPLEELARVLIRRIDLLAAGGSSRWHEARTDAAGNYVLADVPTGRYVVLLDVPGYEPGSTGQIVVRDTTSVTCQTVYLRTIASHDFAVPGVLWCPDDLPEALLASPAPELAGPPPDRDAMEIRRAGSVLRLRRAAHAGAWVERRAVETRLRLPPEVADCGPDVAVVSLRAATHFETADTTWTVAACRPHLESGEFRADLAPGAYFLAATAEGRLRAAAVFEVSAAAGDGGGPVAPQLAWRRMQVDAHASGSVDEAADDASDDITVAMFPRGRRPTAGEVVARPWTITGAIDGFPERNHRIAPRAGLWVASTFPAADCSVTARRGRLAGRVRVAFGTVDHVDVPLEPGVTVSGRAPREFADLLIASSDGTSEILTLPTTERFGFGPLPRGRYLLTASVMASLGGRRAAPVGIDTDHADASGEFAVALSSQCVSARLKTVVVGWAPPGVNPIVYRDGAKTSPVPTTGGTGGFRTALLDRKVRTATVLFVPPHGRGPAFGSVIRVGGAEFVASFPAPDVAPLRIDAADLEGAQGLELIPRVEDTPGCFVHRWSSRCASGAPVEIPAVPRGTYHVRCFDGERVIREFDVSTEGARR